MVSRPDVGGFAMPPNEVDVGVKVRPPRRDLRASIRCFLLSRRWGWSGHDEGIVGRVFVDPHDPHDQGVEPGDHEGALPVNLSGDPVTVLEVRELRAVRSYHNPRVLQTRA